jgi:UDP-4-amino-4,6-dideoxy-N-acetyl-beta-L-altrosamine transaminase
MSDLAIDGGTPVRKSRLNYGRQWLDEDDIQAVENVLRGDWLTMGPTVEEFEKAVAEYVGAKYGIAVNSGTAALHVAAFAAGIGPGDEVIVSPMTFAASSNCILYLGGTPVFADILPGTMNLDPADVERKITKRTKAIVTVDYTGQPCEYDSIRSIAQRHNLIVIEDAAHALGATYHGRKIGTLSEITTFSFHPVKHITTGEGGMAVTNDQNLAARMRNFRSHGIDLDFRQRTKDRPWFYQMVYLGFNYRLPDIGCALGLSQLNKMDKFIARRRGIAAHYNEVFSEIPELTIPEVIPDCEPAWHLYVIRLNLELLKVGRTEIFKALAAEGLGVNVHYIPVPWHPYYQDLGYEKSQWPVTESVYERLISLPIFPAMSDLDVKDVISAITKVVEHYKGVK